MAQFSQKMTVVTLAAICFILSFTLVAMWGGLPSVSAHPDPFEDGYLFEDNGSDSQVPLCHNNEGASDYSAVQANAQAIVEGTNQGHPAGGIHSLDIIPPFHFDFDDDGIEDAASPYYGRNWTPENEALWLNDCDAVTPDPVGYLVVRKVIQQNAYGQKDSSDFNFNVNGGSFQPFEADGVTEITVPVGSYTVTEQADTTYVTSYENCTNVTVNDGYTVTCTITNSYDVCPNLSELQTDIPAGYHLADGICIANEEPPVDVCPNVEGDQATVPVGYHLDGSGDCVVDQEPPLDACPNIEGGQAAVPAGYHLDNSGNCVINTQAPTDVCPNITGDQLVVPLGMIVDGLGNCVVSQANVTPTPTPTPVTTGTVASATNTTDTTTDDPADTTEQLALVSDDSSDDSGEVLGASTLAATGNSATYLVWAMLLGGSALLGLAALSLVGKKL